MWQVSKGSKHEEGCQARKGHGQADHEAADLRQVDPDLYRIAHVDFDSWNPAVLPDEFEGQLARMRSKTVLPLQEFVRLHVRKGLLRNAVAITFDDRYVCNALVATPILESFGSDLAAGGPFHLSLVFIKALWTVDRLMS